MADKLRVSVVGGLGLMASPMAVHWKKSQAIEVVRVHDRGTKDSRRDFCRERWKVCGAERESSLAATVSDPSLDGVFICCGKNGDDGSLVREICSHLKSDGGKFICHLSTVSARFAERAFHYCQRLGIHYVNYPLTGGPGGAEAATMLILAGGDLLVFEKLTPALSQLGKPKHFGLSARAGAEVKLIGHLMVFNGLLGIGSAIATHAECFQGGALGGKEQVEFFDFLNQGAGGTKQWDLVARLGVEKDQWTDTFPLKYAAVDALYVAELCLEKKVSRLVSESVLNMALAFSFVLNEVDAGFSTHSIVRELIASRRESFDQFIEKYRESDLEKSLQNAVNSLPAAIVDCVDLETKALA